MGEMADFLLAQVAEFEDLAEDYKLGGMTDAEAYEEGIIDEQGYAYLNSKNLPVYGLGPCPKCGSETSLMKGKYGKFYGCFNFPKCKGSRNYVYYKNVISQNKALVHQLKSEVIEKIKKIVKRLKEKG